MVLVFIKRFFPLFFCTFFVQDLNEINPKVAELDENNALALAIVSPGRLCGF